MYYSEKLSHIRALGWFFGFNICLSLGLNYTYIVLSTGWNKLLSIVFLHTALVSNILLIYLVVALPLFTLAIGSRYRTPLFILSVLILSTLHILNFIDIAIYRIFKFHINSMVLNLVFTEGTEDSLHLGFNTLATLAAIMVGIVAIEILLINKVFHRFGPKPISKRCLSVTLTIGLLMVLADKLTFAVSDLYNRSEVTRFSRVFPLYQPLTIRRLMQQHLGFKVDREEILQLDRSYSSLNYPKRPLTAPKQAALPNIVWIVIDGWRYDMLSEELTPNIWDFSKRSTVFTNHYSGSNASRFGIFALFYGIHGYYWYQFLSERQGPVFINQLKKLRYDFKIISSSKLTNPEFRRTAFIEIPEHIVDTLEGNRAEQKDPLLTTTFLSWLSTRDTSKPFFAFLFYDAPHGSYSYPDEFEKFTPSNKNPNYLTIGKKDSLTLLNSYKNAVYFDDSEIGKVLTSMENRGLWDNTILIITGDHGEEFYESGFWGHTSSFSTYQTKVPLLLYIPHKAPGKVDYLTSHIDIVATMLELLGYESDIPSYSQGQSLLEGQGHDYIVVSGWDDCAIIDSEHVLIFSFESYNLASWEVRDTQYLPLDNNREILKQKRSHIMNVVEGFGEFLK